MTKCRTTSTTSVRGLPLSEYKTSLAFAAYFADESIRRRVRSNSIESNSTPEGPAPLDTAAYMAKSEVKYLSDLYQELFELRMLKADPENGIAPLNEGVFNQSRDLLVNTAIQLVFTHGGKPVPHGCASTDEDGGLRVTWFRDNINVSLVYPADGSKLQPYIFHKFAGEEAIASPATDVELAKWLDKVGD